MSRRVASLGPIRRSSRRRPAGREDACGSSGVLKAAPPIPAPPEKPVVRPVLGMVPPPQLLTKRQTILNPIVLSMDLRVNCQLDPGGGPVVRPGTGGKAVRWMGA